VTDGRGRLGEDVGLVHPALDMNVRRNVAELELVSARRQQYADGEIGHGFHRLGVHLGGRRECCSHAAEADVHEWAVVSRPPVRERLRLCLGGRMTEARDLERGRIDRLRKARQVGRLGDPLGNARTPLVERGRGDRERGLFHEGDPDCNPHVRETVEIRGDCRSKLAVFSHDDVRPPVLDRLHERRQHCIDVQPGEDDAHDHDVSLTGRERRHPAPQRAQDLVRWHRSRLEGIAASLERRRPDDEGVVPVPHARLDERDQRSEVAGALCRREEDAHEA
jgi:hypothetical protein